MCCGGCSPVSLVFSLYSVVVVATKDQYLYTDHSVYVCVCALVVLPSMLTASTGYSKDTLCVLVYVFVG